MDTASVEFSAGVKTPDLEGGLDEPKDVSIESPTWNWDDDPNNPYNWPASLKSRQLLMISSAAFTA